MMKNYRSQSINVINWLVIIVISTMLIMTLGLTFPSSIIQVGMAQPPSPYPFGEGGHYKFGTISSVQLDKTGRPEWILSGHWKSNLLNISSTTSNQTINTTALGFTSTPEFDASIRMVMVNGSAPHTHTVTNLKLLKITNLGKNTHEFNGTATISLKNGPVANVPISIKFAGNNAISIWLDPSKINNHFGNTPIFGTIFNPFKSPPQPMSQRSP